MAFEVPPPEALPVVAARAGGLQLASVALLLVSVVFAIGGQLTLKSAMNEIGRIGSAEVRVPLDTIARVAKEPRLWIGLTLFGISALFWLVVLSRVPLSVAYPFVGVSYILVVLFSRLILHEQVPPLRWVGVVVVAVGIAVVGLSFTRAGRL
jgi:multidrug transporter EmrE-like cation transporter